MNTSVAAPVRRGKCRLEISIDGQAYKVRRAQSPTRGAKVWHLFKEGDPRPRVVVRHHGTLFCSCADHAFRGARCKHLGALVALGLVSGRCTKGGA